MELRDHVLKLIGSDLGSLGASNFRELVNGDEQVFLFTVADRRVAIPYSVRDGVGGYISEGDEPDDDQNETWQTIFSFGGIPEAHDLDQLDKIIGLLPDNNDDIIRFIGSTLSDRLR